MVWSDLDQKLCVYDHCTVISIIASTFLGPCVMMPKHILTLEMAQFRGPCLQYGAEGSHLASRPSLGMMLCHITRAVLETNSNLKNWPLWEVTYTPKIVTKPKCKISDARFKNDENTVFWSLSPLPRKRVNGFVSSTIFEVFFQTVVNFGGHCIDKISTILTWSRPFFSTFRSKIRNLIDKSFYLILLNGFTLNIRSNWMCCVVKKILIRREYPFYHKKWVRSRVTMNTRPESAVLSPTQWKNSFLCSDSLKVQLWRKKIQ